MDKKILTVDPEKCTGCRNCELVCSVMHNGVSNPSLARIQIVKWEDIGVYIPMSCQHCEDAPCMAVCPKDAIYKDPELESIRINHDLCIGCETCTEFCQFDAIRMVEGQANIDFEKCMGCGVCTSKTVHINLFHLSP